jgi:glucan-binding YG repeat protein
MDSTGVMTTNKWTKDGEKWYFLKEDGSMATGWINDNEKWYYLDLSGAMLSNTNIDGYDLGSDGAWIQ